MSASIDNAATADLSVCAVVVSFEPEVHRIERLCLSLEGQCQYIIVDNGSGQATVTALRRIVTGHGILLELDDNLGIAAAQNAGAKYAAGQLRVTPQYLLFLDQDSVPVGDFITTLRREYESIKRQDPAIGALGPALFDPRNQQLQELHHESFGMYWKRKLRRDDPAKRFQVASVNSSGTLVEMAVFGQIGEFREDLFIDHVDTEWSHRARHLGHNVYVTTRVVMEHEMGRGLERFWLLGKKSFPSRAPLRHYYLFRNNVYLLSQPQMSRTWKFWSIAKLLFTYCYFAVLSADRKEQRSMMLRGVRAGRKAKLGKFIWPDRS